MGVRAGTPLSRRALITGIGGQDGSLLAELLLAEGYDVYGVIRRPGSAYPNLDGIRNRVELIQAELTDPAGLVGALRASRPEEVYNLASASFVPMSWEEPVLTAELAAVGATALLEAIRAVDASIRFYQASSSEIFGEPVASPQDEDTPLNPLTPYGVAKAYAHFIARSYRKRYGLHASCGILFNHTSPRQSMEFLPRKVANAAASISLGLTSEVLLGELSARRDWGFAGDYVRAQWLMVQQDAPRRLRDRDGRDAFGRRARGGGLHPCRARLAGARARRRVAEARQSGAARPGRGRIPSPAAARMGAAAFVPGARSAARRRRG